MNTPLGGLLKIIELSSLNDRREAVLGWISQYIRTAVSEATAYKNLGYCDHIKEIQAVNRDKVLDELVPEVIKHVRISEVEYMDRFKFVGKVDILVRQENI